MKRVRGGSTTGPTHSCWSRAISEHCPKVRIGRDGAARGGTRALERDARSRREFRRNSRALSRTRVYRDQIGETGNSRLRYESKTTNANRYCPRTLLRAALKVVFGFHPATRETHTHTRFETLWDLECLGHLRERERERKTHTRSATRSKPHSSVRKTNKHTCWHQDASIGGCARNNSGL